MVQTAADNMIAATEKIENVARQLDSGMQMTLAMMTASVNQATQALAYVGHRLQSVRLP